ncbi:MAG: bifunctional UDP-N-acetylglucosamine diphosphorylase/glucosamine-1-phosphate N-acetyltransferase GlmU, partial [Actinobacteria bacterium]|nr:bifunctional UDP-N-acetylglucosamine diphosphorylase/glucosamine-1-phosphate N-acetyltransferase GlmU [Actinomycetota bacterium]
LHRVCGRSMVEWVIGAAREAGAGEIVCVVRPGDGVAEGLPDGVTTVEQAEGEGTGAAVLAAEKHVAPGPVVILSGDHPLVTAEQLRGLVDEHQRAHAVATLLTTDQLDPAGYGRIVRSPDGRVERIVETKRPEEASAEELAIREVNLGSYTVNAPELFDALGRIELDDQGERYLTGVFPVIRAAGGTIATHATQDPEIALGVNDRADLMDAERLAQRRILAWHAREGVTFLGPDSTRVEVGVTIGPDATIGPGVSLLGATRVAAGAEVGPHTTARDSLIGEGATVIQAYLVEAEVQAGATVGPFAYLRPGTVVREGAKIGTFVEVKNSDVGAGAKVPHLSYIGDADVDERANLGASTITANYDGRKKHRTKVGKSAKTGVHTSLVAPVDIGDRAYTGAGSVITGDVPDGALGIGRAKQRNIEGYADRVEEDSK